MKNMFSYAAGVGNRQARRRSLKKVVTTVAAGLSVALMTSGALASTRIFLYENGVPVDETASYTYSDSHLIWTTTMAVVGGTHTGDAVTLYDNDGNIIGYLDFSDPME